MGHLIVINITGQAIIKGTSNSIKKNRRFNNEVK